MPDAAIFISYRRDDAAGYARAVADALGLRFGPERVFIDADDVGAGEPFASVIGQAVGGAQVLLVLIGKRWLGERDGLPPRITEPADMVRREVAAALAGGMQVIPLLLDGAPMPAAAVLPSDLQPLAGRHALALDNGRFAADIERLAAVLRGAVDGPRQPAQAAPAGAVPRRRRPAWAVWLAAGVLAAGAAGGIAAWVLLRDAGGATSATAPGAAPPPAAGRAAVNGLWEADVRYDWPNAQYTERFDLGGEGAALHGTASFLRVPRGALEGAVGGDGLRFVTRTVQTLGADRFETVHRYHGRLVVDELQFVMQTEGGPTPHAPVSFNARRAAPPASAPPPAR